MTTGFLPAFWWQDDDVFLSYLMLIVFLNFCIYDSEILLSLSVIVVGFTSLS